jgi:transposase
MARRFSSEFKRDVGAVARRSGAACEEFASDFGISVDSLRRWMKQADTKSCTAASPSIGGPHDLAARRRRLRLVEQASGVLLPAATYLSRDVLPE